MRKVLSWIGTIGAAMLIVVHLRIRGGPPGITSAWGATVMGFALVALFLSLIYGAEVRRWHGFMGWAVTGYGALYLVFRTAPPDITDAQVSSSPAFWVGGVVFLICLLLAAGLAPNMDSGGKTKPARTR